MMAIKYYLLVFLSLFIFGLSFQVIRAERKQWVHPGRSPENAVIDTPIPVPMSSGRIGNIKRGGLTVNSSGSASSNGFMVARGRVGIGIGASDPSPFLDVEVAGKLGIDLLCNLKDSPECLSVLDFKNRIANKNANQSSDPLPSGTISMFLEKCPADWDEYTDMNGKFPRGVKETETVTETKQILQGYRCPNIPVTGNTCYSDCKGQLESSSSCQWKYWVKRFWGRRCEGNQNQRQACNPEYKSETLSRLETYGVGQAGGSDQHTHSAGYTPDRELSGRNSLRLIVSSVSPESNIPPYRDVLFCKKK